MKVLSIETSCDETAVSILEAHGGFEHASFRILGNALLSQIDVHKEYGGVFPMIAKREHSKNLVPLLETALLDAGHLKTQDAVELPREIETVLEREPELLAAFRALVPTFVPPDIDYIVVTAGPGLEPALWVGINFAKALALLWNKPIVPVNHMEGHILASLLTQINPDTYELQTTLFPVLSLLISGGHTELVLMKEPFVYEYLGQTRDDAAGEAFDKVARLLGLPYPGGPEISRLAEEARAENLPRGFELPRPMLHSDDLDFSFSGLKTAVRYLLRDLGTPAQEQVKQIAREFEDAVTEALVGKVRTALNETGARTLSVGGGVSANKHICETLQNLCETDFPETNLRIPVRELTTDNALMIGVAGSFRASEHRIPDSIRANGNLSL